MKMKYNQFEIIEQITRADTILENIFQALVEHNMEMRELNIDTSPQLSISLSNLNQTVEKINRITNQI